MRLGINIDHFATLRQARRSFEPDPIAAALIADMAGADGIVLHLREDRRHINDDDLRRARETVKSYLNLEMAPVDEIVKIAIRTKPEIVTLVPERREEVTTEGGLDVIGQKEHLHDVICRFSDAGIKVSLFIDPDMKQIKESSRVGAFAVELHTGAYANAKTDDEMTEELEKLKTAALAASRLGLSVAAGHGLNYHNVKAIAAIKEIEELNIGHSIVSRASLVGLEKAVQEMIRVINR